MKDRKLLVVFELLFRRENAKSSLVFLLCRIKKPTFCLKRNPGEQPFSLKVSNDAE
jgi:hypothetical protein